MNLYCNRCMQKMKCIPGSGSFTCSKCGVEIIVGVPGLETIAHEVIESLFDDENLSYTLEYSLNEIRGAFEKHVKSRGQTIDGELTIKGTLTPKAVEPCGICKRKDGVLGEFHPSGMALHAIGRTTPVLLCRVCYDDIMNACGFPCGEPTVDVSLDNFDIDTTPCWSILGCLWDALKRFVRKEGG